MQGRGQEKRKRDKASDRLTTKTTTKGDPEWSSMMEFFKSNPAALMDALPTPPGSEDGEEHKQPAFDQSTVLSNTIKST